MLILAQTFLFIIATTENPGSQRYDIIKKNVVCSNAGTGNGLKLVVHVTFERCQVLLG